MTPTEFFLLYTKLFNFVQGRFINVYILPDNSVLFNLVIFLPLFCTLFISAIPAIMLNVRCTGHKKSPHY